MSNDHVAEIVEEKLNKINFHAWRRRFTNFLIRKGYWDYIEVDHEKAP